MFTLPIKHKSLRTAGEGGPPPISHPPRQPALICPLEKDHTPACMNTAVWGSWLKYTLNYVRSQSVNSSSQNSGPKEFTDFGPDWL